MMKKIIKSNKDKDLGQGRGQGLMIGDIDSKRKREVDLSQERKKNIFRSKILLLIKTRIWKRMMSKKKKKYNS